MKKLTSAAGIALALVAGSAIAADLPSRKAPPVYVAPAPVLTWTGIYGGINIGYGFGNNSNENGGLAYLSGFAPVSTTLPLASAWTLPQNLNGVLGGGQVGYNYQFNPWLVVGLEADWQASDVHSTVQGWNGVAEPAPWFGHLQTAYSTKSVDWFGTVRGRIGVTLPSIPQLLVFGTGGVAYGGVVHNASFADTFTAPTTAAFGFGTVAKGNYDDTRIGWAAGGGIEYLLNGWHPLLTNFSVKIEYLYTDLGSTRTSARPLTGGPILVGVQESPTRFHTVRAGVNWHFNPFAAAPVLAKY